MKNNNIRSILSIGLNVENTEPSGQLQKTLDIVGLVADFDCYRLGSGSWNGITERSIHIVLQTARSPRVDLIAEIASCLKQDCIAFTYADPQSAEAVGWALVAKDGSMIRANENLDANGQQFTSPVFSGENLTDAKQAKLFAFLQEEELAVEMAAC